MTEMSPLERIVLAALERTDATERDRYLTEACADDAELRTRVERMLEAMPALGGFFEKPAVPPPPTDLGETVADYGRAAPPGETVDAGQHVILEGPGSRIGPYKLLQKIGEGGMGTVFMAEQEKPVRRKVALKVIKPGMDTGQLGLARLRMDVDRQVSDSTTRKTERAIEKF